MITLRANNKEHIVIPSIFPDKTSQVWQLPKELLEANVFEIEWKFDSESEFMHLAQLKYLIDASGDGTNQTNLIISYLPYARQDKLVSNDTTFALATFAYLLNKLYFDSVYVDDPHSFEAVRLIDRLVYSYPFL